MHSRLRSCTAEEQAVLTGFASACCSLDGVDSIVYRCEHSLARSERIHGAGFNQTFEDALVEIARLDTFAEFVEGLELALAGARFPDGLSGIFAYVLGGGEADADRITDGREVEIAFVDIRRKYRDAHA